MKTHDLICTLPKNPTPDNLISLAEQLRTASKMYEKFELTSDDEGADILGIREETADEQKHRLNIENEERVKEQHRKEKEQQRINAVLEKNPGVVYHKLPVQSPNRPLLKNIDCRKVLALSMSEPYGHFTKDGRVISWYELNHD